MPQVNDLAFTALRGLGFEGSLGDMLYAWKRAQGGWNGWDAFLTAQGFTEGALSDRKFAYWESVQP